MGKIKLLYILYCYVIIDRAVFFDQKKWLTKTIFDNDDLWLHLDDDDSLESSQL